MNFPVAPTNCMVLIISFLEYIDTFLLMIPATLLGSRIGQYLLDKISNKLFFYIFIYIKLENRLWQKNLLYIIFTQ